MEKETKRGTIFKKKAFIDVYEKVYGNVSLSCRSVGINRSTYYRWVKDEAFKEQLEDTKPKEAYIDFVESKLVERINAGDTTAIIFALKTIGKKRGYVERQEIAHSSNVETDVTFEIHERKKEA